jgi:hypothetical protein
VDLTESGLQVLVGIGYCAWRYRIFREIQASNFACGGKGKLRCDAGFVALSIGIWDRIRPISGPGPLFRLGGGLC